MVDGQFQGLIQDDVHPALANEGTTFAVFPAPQKGGSIAMLPVPIIQPTANTALYFKENSAATTVYVTLSATRPRRRNVALTFGTVVEASTASGSSLALNMGTLALNDVVVMVASINQSANEDIFTSWAKAAGTSAVSATTEIVVSQGAEMYLSVGICRVTSAGTLTMTGTLTGARRWIAGGFWVTGVPKSLAVADIINPTIGEAAGTGSAPSTSPTVSPETAGDTRRPEFRGVSRTVQYFATTRDESNAADGRSSATGPGLL